MLFAKTLLQVRFNHRLYFLFLDNIILLRIRMQFCLQIFGFGMITYLRYASIG